MSRRVDESFASKAASGPPPALELVMCFECYWVTAAIGALLGLLATFATRTKRLVFVLANIGIGIAGAVSMAWFVSPLAGNPAAERVGTSQLVGAVFGGVVLLALYKAIRPDT